MVLIATLLLIRIKQENSEQDLIHLKINSLSELVIESC